MGSDALRWNGEVKMFPENPYYDAALGRLSDMSSELVDKHVPRNYKLDRYLAASQLQKAVRRSEYGLAWEAAVYLLRHNTDYFWRRLPIIALEDVGVADPELIIAVILASTRCCLREEMGGSFRAAASLVNALCAAPKDRAADDLYDVVSRDPHLLDQAARWAEEPIETILERPGPNKEISFFVALQLARLADQKGDLSCNRLHKGRWIEAMEYLGPETSSPLVLEASVLGLKATGSILAPMLFAVGAQRDRGVGVVDDEMPAQAAVWLPPPWVAGMHTRAGLAGFRKFISRSPRTKELLRFANGDVSQSRIVGALVFRLDCGQLRRRLDRAQSGALKARATGLGWGIPDEVVPDMLEALRMDFALLNECRAEALKEYFN